MRYLPLCLALTACATSYRGAVTGPSAFSFALSPEQCLQLQKERRTYRATQDTSIYVGGAGALVTATLLAIPALRDQQAAQGAAAGVSLAAGAVGAFTASQVSGLDDELAAGECPR